MARIVLAGISREAVNASKAIILEHAAKLQYKVEVLTVSDMTDLPALLPKYDILAIEKKNNRVIGLL